MSGTSRLTRDTIDSAAAEHERTVSAAEGHEEQLSGDSVLCFRVGSIWMAVPAHMVDLVADFEAPTPVPRAPAHVLGVISLRGRAAAVVDVATFLHLPDSQFVSGIDSPRGRAPDARPRIVVTNVQGMRVGIACDQVTGVLELARGQRREPLAIQGQRLLQFTAAEIEGPQGLTALLDLPSLIAAARVARSA